MSKKFAVKLFGVTQGGEPITATRKSKNVEAKCLLLVLGLGVSDDKKVLRDRESLYEGDGNYTDLKGGEKQMKTSDCLSSGHCV